MFESKNKDANNFKYFSIIMCVTIQEWVSLKRRTNNEQRIISKSSAVQFKLVWQWKNPDPHVTPRHPESC